MQSTSIKDIEKFLNPTPIEVIDKDSINLITAMKEDEQVLITLQAQLAEIKKNELIRINFEFIKNNYERRFNISHEEIISVIVGEENALNEITKQKRELKVFLIIKILYQLFIYIYFFVNIFKLKYFRNFMIR